MGLDGTTDHDRLAVGYAAFGPPALLPHEPRNRRQAALDDVHHLRTRTGGVCSNPRPNSRP